jgi:hypothetical protein
MSDWNNKVKRILKSELVKRGISTEELAALLNENGCTETKSSVDSKISRGTFSASFFVQCMYVIGCEKIEIENYRPKMHLSNMPLAMAAEPIVHYKNNRNAK